MLPQLRRIRKSKTYINIFRGLNRTVNTGFSRVSSNSTSIYTEFKDMKNLCGDDYPQLRSRKQRSRIVTDKKVISNLLAVNGSLVFIDESGNLNYDGQTYAVEDIDTSKEHNLVMYGNNVVILPDNLVFSIANKNFKEINVVNDNSNCNNSNVNQKTYTDKYDYVYEKCAIEKVDFKSSGKPRNVNCIVEHYIDFSDLSFQKKQSDGTFHYETIFKNIKVGDTVESVHSLPSVLYRCTAIENAPETGVYIEDKIRRFVKIEDYYTKISSFAERHEYELQHNIKVGDFIKITSMEKNKAITDENKDKDELWGDYYENLNDKTFKVYGISGSSDGIIIKSSIESSVPYAGSIAVEKVKPESDSDKCIEVNNRLWTCSSENNEIYACKQGDCTNWQAYSDGIATDSYAMTVGSEGDFTGIARQNDSVIFFKENWVLKIYGTKPSNYTLATYNVLGVQKGSAKSVVWINGVLYYLSTKGVCRYSPGSQPEVISEDAFGDVKYRNGVAGRHNNKYYISAQNDSGEYELFVFDTETGLWHKEDNTQMLSAVTYNNTMYYIDGNTGYIMCPDDSHNLISDSSEYEREGEFDWSCETGDLYDSDFNAKYISRINIGIKCEKNTEIKVYAQFEEDSGFRELRTIRYDRKKPQMIPVAVRRSDYLRLRFEGKGQCNIYGISIEYAQGSRVR
ncbi:MAG: hypothetical protein ACI4XI_10205 [Ruminococcus sp.]